MLNYNLVQYALYIKLYIFDNTTSILVSWYRTVGGFFNIKFRFSKENVKISLQMAEWNEYGQNASIEIISLLIL